MKPDESVVRAIGAAVAADPDNDALRIHYGQLLFDAEQFSEALAQLEVVLARRPDEITALGLAAEAGSELGDPRAEGWRRLFELSTARTDPRSHEQASEPAPQEPRDRRDAQPVGSTPTNATDGPDWDAFLRDVLQDRGGLAPITLDDVGGLEDVKERLQLSFFLPIRNPELQRTFGSRSSGGLLLWGPPGCGKTFLARAIAGEIGARFIPVGLDQILDMWLGNSEKQVHELFEGARSNSPCVLFFDELDAIGHSRMKLSSSAVRNVVAQLLTELDGVESTNEGLFVIGATNQPWDVDPALRRPGRFDRTMLILPPDQAAREAILRYHLRGRFVGPVDFDVLGRNSDGLSGADLRLACDDAAERALRDAIGASVIEPIGMTHLVAAMSAVKPSTAAWFESARNHVRYANESGEYDELAQYLRRRPKRKSSDG